MTPRPPYPWTLPGVLQGIDVSSAQRPNLVLMQIAVAAGCIAADIKACDYDTTKGMPFQDPALLDHLRYARAVGLRPGTYAFFKSLFPWQAQAEQYLRTLDATGPLAIRPTLDWEDAARIQNDPHRALDGVLQWRDFVHRRTGRRPTCYTGKNVTDILERAGVDASGLLAFDLFQAHYRWDPVTGHDYGLTAPAAIYLGATRWPLVAWQCGGNGAPRLTTPPDAAGHVQIASVDIDRDVYPNMADPSVFDTWCADPPFTLPITRPALDLTRPRDLQAALVALGYDPGPLDGVLGPRTATALRAFQAAHGLTVDGIAGPRTRAALAAALGPNR